MLQCWVAIMGHADTGHADICHGEMLQADHTVFLKQQVPKQIAEQVYWLLLVDFVAALLCWYTRHPFCLSAAHGLYEENQ